MIVPVKYNPHDGRTNFGEIIQDASTVCLYAENLESLRALIKAHETACVRGMPNASPIQTGSGQGTACVRGKPNASPIPTGFGMGGFRYLDQIVDNFKVQDLIDACFEGLRTKITNNPNKFRKVVYSADADGKWSCGIFTVGDKVLNYITKKIKELNNDKEFIDCFVQTSDIRKMDNFDSFFSRAP